MSRAGCGWRTEHTLHGETGHCQETCDQILKSSIWKWFLSHCLKKAENILTWVQIKSSFVNLDTELIWFENPDSRYRAAKKIPPPPHIKKTVHYKNFLFSVGMARDLHRSLVVLLEAKENSQMQRNLNLS